MPKQPRAVLDNIFAFSPNRETLGATAYLIVENNANILVDCPPWDES
ncbi:MAG: MBL fold metallo-hydrolase, partial [Chroococcales cyanobacterium]